MPTGGKATANPLLKWGWQTKANMKLKKGDSKIGEGDKRWDWAGREI